MLEEIVLRREDLAELNNCNYEIIKKQQAEATCTFLRKEDNKSEDEGFGKQPTDTSTFKDVSSMVKIGKKRTYQQMNAELPSSKVENV